MLEIHAEIIQKLKFTKRRGWLERELDADSIAAHVYGSAVLGWIIADEEKVDKNRVVEMLLIHDFVMAKMEDVTPKSGKYGGKGELEEEAKNLVVKSLPAEKRDEYLSLFNEFQAQETKESQVAREADKLETLLQGEVYEENTKKNDILDEFIETYSGVFKTRTGKKLFDEIVSRHDKRK
jgi:putative hydrolase of HD superfamily